MKMEHVNTAEVEKRIGYWQYALSKIDKDMLDMQSKRVDIKQTLAHLNNLQTHDKEFETGTSK